MVGAVYFVKYLKRRNLAQTQKKVQCPRTDEWTKKLWYICTIEHYLVIKKNKAIKFAT